MQVQKILLSAVMLILMAGCSTDTAVSASPAVTTASMTTAPSAASENEDASQILLQLAEAQHTTRTFQSQQIPDEDLQKLLAVSFSGATSGGQQARDVVVVKDKDIMKQIQAVHVYAQSLDTAPVVFVFTGDEGRAIYPGNLCQDTSIAAQNVVLMAQSLGIATNIMSIYPSEDRISGIQKALQLPEKVIPYIMISMGYSGEDTTSASSSKSSDYSSMVHNDTWN